MDRTELEYKYQKYRNLRKQIMDASHLSCGHLPTWENFRARLLKLMGRTGMESLFLEDGTTEQTDWKDNGPKKN